MQGSRQECGLTRTTLWLGPCCATSPSSAQPGCGAEKEKKPAARGLFLHPLPRPTRSATGKQTVSALWPPPGNGTRMGDGEAEDASATWTKHRDPYCAD